MVTHGWVTRDPAVGQPSPVSSPVVSVVVTRAGKWFDFLSQLVHRGGHRTGPKGFSFLNFRRKNY